MNFFRYLQFTNDQKTRWLLDEAQRDESFSRIVNNLQVFGSEIKHSFFEGNGIYQPYAVSVNSEDFREEFLKQHPEGKMKACFRIGMRHGAGAALFHFLHELVHFHQDLNGLFLYPMKVEGQTPVQPDLESQIALLQHCEATAATESICGAYRMKQAGYPMAWRGAMGSFNWRGMARRYARARDAGLSEAQAAKDLYEEWYKTGQSEFCEQEARASYQPLPPQHERRVEIFADGTLSGASDIRIGTPPYLWNIFRSFDAPR